MLISRLKVDTNNIADLVDTYLMYAASAIAANTVARSACGAAAPLFTDQMFTKLGIGGGGSLIGGVAILLALIPFAFYKYGESIRVKSKFSPTGPAKKVHDDSDDAEKGQSRARVGSDGDVSSSDHSSEGTAPSDHEEEEADAHERRGDRESLDSNPFEYRVDNDQSVRHH